MYRFSDFPPQTIRDTINEVIGVVGTPLSVIEISDYIFENLEIGEPVFDEHQKQIQTIVDDMVASGRLTKQGKEYSLGDNRKNGDEETYHIATLESPAESPAKLKGNVIVNTIGSEYYTEPWLRITEPTITVELIPEPQNPYDNNAVAVVVNSQIIGHLTRSNARQYFNTITKLNSSGYTLQVDGEVLESPSNKNYRYVQLAMPSLQTIENYLA